MVSVGWCGEAGRGVAIDEAGVAGRKGRQRGAVDLVWLSAVIVKAAAVSQRAVHIRDGVIGIDGAAGGDVVGSRRDCWRWPSSSAWAES